MPKSTLARRLAHSNSELATNLTSTICRPNALNVQEESALCQVLMICADWGFPLQIREMQDIVKSYLDENKKAEKRFRENRPSRDWVLSFLKRNPLLSTRLCSNIKRARAAVTPEVLHHYFDNLIVVLADVPPPNIVNCDESNFTDDPGQILVIARRGAKHVERIRDTSKQSTSVMASVTGDGQDLPFHVVYKAKNMFPTWAEGGLKDTRYSCTESGWFTMEVFEEWFQFICFPYLKTLEGPKVVLGDNLGSHISPKVVRMCDENNIRFVLLPPNSTHFTQPLDVAWFGPVKKVWRKTLDDWKDKHRGPVPKACFPGMLKKTVEELGEKSSRNITSGFRACGLIPLDRQQVLKRVPSKGQQNNTSAPTEPGSTWTAVLVNHLSATRSNIVDINPKARGKKFPVPAGKSVTYEDLMQNETESLKRKKNRFQQTEEEEIEELMFDNEDEKEVNKCEKRTKSPASKKRKRTSKTSNKENVNPLPPIQEKDFVIVQDRLSMSDILLVE